MNGQTADPQLVIQRSAILHNWRVLKRLTKKATIAPVVKANGYGLGAERIARLLWREGARNFFVFSFEEGLALRQTLPPNARIMLLGGIPLGDTPQELVRTAIAKRLLPVVSTSEQLALWREAAHGYTRKYDSPLPLVLHFDVGMNRYALPAQDLHHIASDLAHHFQGLRPALWMAHLSSAERGFAESNSAESNSAESSSTKRRASEQQEQNTNQSQRLLFENLAKLLPPAPLSLANSAGIALGTEWHFNLVRPGAALYGLEAAAFAKLAPLKRAVHLRARVVQIQEVSKGSTVGYNETWCANQQTRLATIAIGYADGLAVRSLQAHRRTDGTTNGTTGGTTGGTVPDPQGAAPDPIRDGQLALWCKQIPLPVRGRISMDLVSVEATAAPFLKVGDWLDLFPPEASDTGSRDLSALPYEAAFPYARDALCALGTRVQRVFV